MSKPTGNPPGRTPKYSTPEEMWIPMSAYFEKCKEGTLREYYDAKRKTVVKVVEHVASSMERLSIHLGFSGVSSMWNGYNKKAGFSELLVYARTMVAADIIEGTMSGRYPAHFSPFLLCNLDKANYQSINKPELNLNLNFDRDKKLTMANSRLPKDVTPKRLAAVSVNKGEGN